MNADGPVLAISRALERFIVTDIPALRGGCPLIVICKGGSVRSHHPLTPHCQVRIDDRILASAPAHRSVGRDLVRSNPGEGFLVCFPLYRNEPLAERAAAPHWPGSANTASTLDLDAHRPAPGPTRSNRAPRGWLCRSDMRGETMPVLPVGSDPRFHTRLPARCRGWCSPAEIWWRKR